MDAADRRPLALPPKQLSPSRVGRYFHLECKRFLRYDAVQSVALRAEGVPKKPYETRPVARAVMETGYIWEEKALAGPLASIAEIAPQSPGKPTATRDRTHSIEATTELLHRLPPGKTVYQGQMRAPDAFYDAYRLPRDLVDMGTCRPDLIEVREIDGRRTLRVTDLKVSRGLKLSHRVQAALYTLLLERLVEQQGIDAVVERDPAIWLVNEAQPQPFDIRAILPPLEHFLREEVGPLFEAPAQEATWHFNPKCENCPFFEHCQAEMLATDDISRVPGLSSYAKAHLLELDPPVRTVAEFDALLADPGRRAALEQIGSMRGRAEHLRRQVTAMRTDAIVPHGGASLALPIGEHVRLVFTVQTEPVGGNVYAWAVYAQGLRDITETSTVIEAGVATSNDPDEIRRVERDLVRAVHRILVLVHDYNASAADWKDQKSLQAACFDTYEEALLTGVLVRGLRDPEVAEEALAVFFHFQRPELMEASDHPNKEASIPVVVVVRVIQQLLALPVDVMYRFDDLVRLLPNSRWDFTYERFEFFDYELSNQLRPDAIFSLWNDGNLDRIGQIEGRLKARVRGANSLVDGLRQKLDAVAPGALFAWPPKFSLPARMAFDHPVLSRLAFVAQYENVLAGLETRQARVGPLADRLRTGATVELEFLGGDRWRITHPDLAPDLGDDSFTDMLLVPATDEGNRASLLFKDHVWQDKWGAPKGQPLAIAATGRVTRDADDRPLEVTLALRPSDGFPQLVNGARFHLSWRHTDWNTGRMLAELRAADADPDARFVRLLEDASVRLAPRPLPARVRERALALAATHRMTHSQLAAFEHVVDFATTLAWGPPGTGKTHFVALAILCLVEAHRAAGLPYAVLVTAFTHAAIDNCLRKCADLQAELAVVRGGVAIGKIGKTGLAGMSGVEIVDKDQAGRWLGLAEHTVLGGTAWGIAKAVPVDVADLVVIDEGSQLKVPESVIPIRRLAADGRLLVAGDHLQLPPIVKGVYPEAMEGEPLLHRSIFEALRGPNGDGANGGGAGAGGGVMVSLLENFRMNGVLCRYPAHQIYDERYGPFDDVVRHRRLALAGGPGDGLEGILVDPAYPLVIVESSDFRATNENELEATIVANVAERLRRRLLAPDGRPYASDADFWEDGVFIVSPHHAHIGLIKRKLRAKGSWGTSAFVGTVDKMQGQECDAVIASYGVADVEAALVESEFIYSLNRLNVSITRGRAKTIVLLSSALTNPPIQAFANEDNATGIGFMQGLVAHAEAHGEVRRFRWHDEARLRVIRVRAPGAQATPSV